MSTRRVIFPPTDYWTQSKENTMTDNYADTPTAADARRASAITIHHRRGNTEGLLTIAHEANENHRTTELVLAILDLHRNPLTELRTPNGIDLIGRHVQELADHSGLVDEPTAADVGRAASLLDSHGRNDTNGINQAMQSACNAGRSTQLLLGLLDLYEHLMPELSSAAGLDWLNRCTTTFAIEEVQDQ
ncbi:hypothetical protein [Mycobacterium sp. M26]|uniref:hypothetical protein n=1 Tax=Mycobacterium sp. M26 TaxID=1762962 RepID=UPI00073EE163|nr:hypothetical protein [Mycobacterium sp. M26]